jgi:hypothetical protein
MRETNAAKIAETMLRHTQEQNEMLFEIESACDTDEWKKANSWLGMCSPKFGWNPGPRFFGSTPISFRREWISSHSGPLTDSMIRLHVALTGCHERNDAALRLTRETLGARLS